MKHSSVIPYELIDPNIIFIRGQRVMIDSDLAKLYGVSTKVLNQAVKRNYKRFPMDFMFELTAEEKKEVVTNCDHLKYLKYSHALHKVFTEHGAIMLASVLNSERAVEASVYVVRAFVRMREVLATHKELSQKIKDLESRIEGHDEQIRDIIEAINQLLLPPEKSKRQIGFQVKEPAKKYYSKKKCLC